MEASKLTTFHDSDWRFSAKPGELLVVWPFWRPLTTWPLAILYKKKSPTGWNELGGRRPHAGRARKSCYARAVDKKGVQSRGFPPRSSAAPCISEEESYLEVSAIHGSVDAHGVAVILLIGEVPITSLYISPAAAAHGDRVLNTAGDIGTERVVKEGDACLAFQGECVSVRTGLETFHKFQTGHSHVKLVVQGIAATSRLPEADLLIDPDVLPKDAQP